jgi:hypothetical protein
MWPSDQRSGLDAVNGEQQGLPMAWNSIASVQMSSTQ